MPSKTKKNIQKINLEKLQKVVKKMNQLVQT